MALLTHGALAGGIVGTHGDVVRTITRGLARDALVLLRVLIERRAANAAGAIARSVALKLYVASVALTALSAVIARPAGVEAADLGLVTLLPTAGYREAG